MFISLTLKTSQHFKKKLHAVYTSLKNYVNDNIPDILTFSFPVIFCFFFHLHFLIQALAAACFFPSFLSFSLLSLPQWMNRLSCLYVSSSFQSLFSHLSYYLSSLFCSSVLLYRLHLTRIFWISFLWRHRQTMHRCQSTRRVVLIFSQTLIEQFWSRAFCHDLSVKCVDIC